MKLNCDERCTALSIHSSLLLSLSLSLSLSSSPAPSPLLPITLPLTHRPTTKELIDINKRVIVIGQKHIADALPKVIFHDMTVPVWDKDTTKHFTPYPQCGGYSPGQWYIVGGESQVAGPFCESQLNTEHC